MIGNNHCDEPAELSNGTGSYTDRCVGSIVTYHCDLGFKLVGKMQQICQESGMWSGTVPICMCQCEC